MDGSVIPDCYVLLRHTFIYVIGIVISMLSCFMPYLSPIIHKRECNSPGMHPPELVTAREFPRDAPHFICKSLNAWSSKHVQVEAGPHSSKFFIMRPDVNLTMLAGI